MDAFSTIINHYLGDSNSEEGSVPAEFETGGVTSSAGCVIA